MWIKKERRGKAKKKCKTHSQHKKKSLQLMQRQQDLQSNEMNPAALDSHLLSKELSHVHARGREGECERERCERGREDRESKNVSSDD